MKSSVREQIVKSRNLERLYAEKALKADLLTYFWLKRTGATRARVWSHMNKVVTR